MYEITVKNDFKSEIADRTLYDIKTCYDLGENTISSGFVHEIYITIYIKKSII